MERKVALFLAIFVVFLIAINVIDNFMHDLRGDVSLSPKKIKQENKVSLQELIEKSGENVKDPFIIAKFRSTETINLNDLAKSESVSDSNIIVAFSERR